MFSAMVVNGLQRSTQWVAEWVVRVAEIYTQWVAELVVRVILIGYSAETGLRQAIVPLLESTE